MVMHSYVLIVNKLHTVKPKTARGLGSNIRQKRIKMTVPKGLAKIMQMNNTSMYTQLILGLNQKRNENLNRAWRPCAKFDLFIPKAVFSRVVREILYDVGKENMDMLGIKNHYRIQWAALAILQKTTEFYITFFFSSKIRFGCRNKPLLAFPTN